MKFSRTLPSPVIQQRTFKLTFGAALAISAMTALAPQAHAARVDRADETEFARGRILVEPREGLSADEFEKIVRGHGGRRRKLGQSNLHVVDLQGNEPDDDVVEKLRRNPHVKYAERDRRVKSTMAVNDPYIGSAWHLTNIGANTAWDSAMGAGVTIAILDSGVDPAHPDLKASLVPGYNSYNNNTDTADVCGHGTAVAGTAAAATNNGVGVAGVAGKARIMPIRIAFMDAATNSCYTYFSTVAAGLTWAADHGARVANVSFAGVAGSSAVQSAAQYMKNKGGLVFVSAGNAGRDEGYTPTTTLVAVSATDNTNTKTSWSSYGNFVSLSAPGSAIWAPVKGGSYSTWNGTSFASPVAAGVAALLMSARPLLTSTQVESMLFSTAVDRGAAGRDALYGYGRVDAARAMQKALGGAAPVADMTAPAVSISAPLANSTASGSVPVNINASDNVGVARVELKVNSTVVAIDSAAPFGFSWNSAGAYNGMNTLVATAYDAAGNVKASAPVSVNVANANTVVARDTTPPAVKIINPVPGMVAGTVTVSINASDNAGAAGISQTLYIDNVAVAQGKGNAMAYSWASSKAAAGLHTIKAVARDAAGNSATTWFQVTK
ncbi:S8 family serine peptidase [Massilia sp. RP-1-19]|uniref:S8 family serine peptidase n=1 Tax=Massilia polaris TaxID=2728846 RepID=A0A848HNV0_9BURK|nr:S8 family serine peptidase [Massilia polaris]NML62677.1 S8 family serine peptidase [Massilia polaris]